MQDINLTTIEKQLHNPDPFLRKAAVKVLFSSELPNKVSLLIELLSDSDTRVRWEVAEALCRLADKSVIDSLIRLLTDQGGFLTREIERVLVRIGEPAIPALVELLTDEKSVSRKCATDILSRIGHPAIVYLTQLLESEQWYIRGSVAEALGKIGMKESIEPISKLLDDTESHVRRKAVEALGRIGEPVTHYLLKAIKDKDYEVRTMAAIALRDNPDPNAIEALINALRDDNSNVRWRATEALSKIGSPAVEPLIRSMIKAGSNQLRRASEALIRIGSSNVSPFYPLLFNNDWKIREVTSEILHRIGWVPGFELEHIFFYIGQKQWDKIHLFGPPAIPYLLNVIDDPTWIDRPAALSAIEKLCNQVESVKFLSSETIKDKSSLTNQDFSSLTYPLKNLNKIVIDTKFTDTSLIEIFLTYFATYHEKETIKKNIDFVILGETKTIPSYISKSFQNSFKKTVIQS